MEPAPICHESACAKRPAALGNDGIRTALVKRVRLNEAARPSAPAASIAAADAVDLCAELFKLAGLDAEDVGGDPDALAALLETHYSPKMAEVIFRIACSAHKVDEEKGESNRQSDEIIDNGHENSRKSARLSDSDCSESEGPWIPGCEHDVLHMFSRVGGQDSDQLVPEPLRTVRSRSSLLTVSDDEFETPAATLDTQQETIRQPNPADVSVPHVAVKAYNKDTEIALSRIFDLGKVASVQDPSIPPFAPYSGPSVVCMSGFGELGRFGNQVLQYAFLRAYAARHNISEVQVPVWAGSELFGLQDRPVQRAFPAVTEFRSAKANSTFTSEFMDYITASNAGHHVRQVGPGELDVSANFKTCLMNVDFWGWFQWHTSCYAPFKSLIQDTFTPVVDLNGHLSSIFNRELRHRDGIKRTVVGLHLRLGDYKNIAASSFGYCAPTSWYLEWLKKIWCALENPILFVASDDIDAVLRDFAEYKPLTADMIDLKMPEALSHLKAGFFPDWWGLSQCDVLAISNSTFSFTACMMNKRSNAQFFRAHYAAKMISFDPWNSEPVIHRDMSAGSLSNALSTLKLVYSIEGTRGLIRNILYEIPYYSVRSGIMKAVLWREAFVRQRELSGDTSTPVAT
jgi:hypothetical protein